jgi:hypothetical protein
MSPKAKKVTKKASRVPDKKTPKSKLTGEIDDKDLEQIAGGLAAKPLLIKLK